MGKARTSNHSAENQYSAAAVDQNEKYLTDEPFTVASAERRSTSPRSSSLLPLVHRSAGRSYIGRPHRLSDGRRHTPGDPPPCNLFRRHDLEGRANLERRQRQKARLG